MRAGLLREKVTFYAITTKQTDSGFVSKTKTNIATVRCYRKRKVDNSQMVGQEEFNAGTVVLQVRNDPRLANISNFSYEDEDYNVLQNLIQIEDNTRLVTGQKINK
jgi:hypothetical protein